MSESPKDLSLDHILPQGDPFRFIDRLLEHGEGHARSTFEVRPNGFFIRRDRLAEPGLIENMAQTTAAWSGYQAYRRGAEPPVGFIGSIVRLEIWKLPVVGTRIETEVVSKGEVLNARLFEAVVWAGDIRLAGCEIRVFLQT